MVAELWGKCNGHDIVFVPNERGRWETAVPAAHDKTYTIELWARDLAGNVGYYATVEVFYDSSMLTMRFRLVDVGPMFHELEIGTVFKSIDLGKWRV